MDISLICIVTSWTTILKGMEYGMFVWTSNHAHVKVTTGTARTVVCPLPSASLKFAKVLGHYAHLHTAAYTSCNLFWMGKHIIRSLAFLVACLSLGAIVFYLGLSRAPLFSTSSFTASFSSKPGLPQLVAFTSHVEPSSSSVNCTCRDAQSLPASTTSSCENATRSVIITSPLEDCKHVASSKGSVVQNEPWYVTGKAWHYPVLFPRCSMDACFNYSRCEGKEELFIYSYDVPTTPLRYFTGIASTQWHTDDADKACLFFVYLDLNRPHRPHPNTLPFWNNGMNHVLVTFADAWNQRELPQQSIGYASVLASEMHETIYRPGFDISISLPGKVHMREMQSLRPYDRKYLLTFRGLRYLGKPREGGVLRSSDAFRSMHNGGDVIVVTSCRQATNDFLRRGAPELGANCDADEAMYAKYAYKELMNTTFALVPSGRQPNSYRMVEVMAAGAVPVLVADNYVKPFDTLIHWHRCILQFPSSEMQRIVPTIRALRRHDVERRQEYCIHIYNAFLKDDSTLLSATITSLKARLLGSLPFSA